MKGVFTLSSLMFALVVVMFVIGGMAVFSTDILITNYPTANVTNYSTIAQLNATTDLTESIHDNIQQASETNTLGAIGFAIKGGWDTVRLMFSSFNIMQSFTGDIEREGILPFAMPSWFMGMITVIITLIIVFSALRFIGKVNI
jgi:hypothetical protein